MLWVRARAYSRRQAIKQFLGFDILAQSVNTLKVILSHLLIRSHLLVDIIIEPISSCPKLLLGVRGVLGTLCS